MRLCWDNLCGMSACITLGTQLLQVVVELLLDRLQPLLDVHQAERGPAAVILQTVP